MVSSGLDLPLAEQSVAELAAVQFVDAIDATSLEAAVLPYWRSLLKSGGHLSIVAIDGEACARLVASGKLSLYEWQRAMFPEVGGGRGNLLWAAALVRLVETLGFVSVSVASLPSKRGRVPLFQINAIRP